MIFKSYSIVVKRRAERSVVWKIQQEETDRAWDHSFKRALRPSCLRLQDELILELVPSLMVGYNNNESHPTNFTTIAALSNFTGIYRSVEPVSRAVSTAD